MVVHIKTTDRDGNILEGNGLLFYATKSENREHVPFIVTLWHVVGLRPDDAPGYALSPPGANYKSEFRLPGVLSQHSRYTIARLIDKCPLEEIDLPIAEAIKPRQDGLCLLEPAAGFAPDQPSQTKLGYPRLQPVPNLSSPVAICFNRLVNNELNNRFTKVDAVPQKRGDSDSYSHAGPPGLLGPGCSGCAILPSGNLNYPPNVVFGLHCGEVIYPSPPNDYLFLGTQTIVKMLRRSGYFYVPDDQRTIEEGKAKKGKLFEKAAERILRSILRNLAP